MSHNTKLEERFDDRNNLIYAKYSDGAEYFQEFDLSNRLIYHKACIPKWDKPYESWERFEDNKAYYTDSFGANIIREFHDDGDIYVIDADEEEPFWMDKRGVRLNK